MVKIEIDGKEIEARPGSMIIEAADDNGVHIPRFCYHKKLSIAANCRMCLVEVDKVGKPLPACATPITDGMRVYTKSSMAKAAQKAVMEFLLLNHPLDCPICDQGGQCELQDNAMAFGRDLSRYDEAKRVVKDKDIGSLIATEMTRCIHCTRCVRFGAEVAGIREMGATGRGETTEIGTYIENSLVSEISGNIIDLCPVGALTAKPSRFTSRPWELRQHESVAPHDCLGSNIYVHSRRGEVMRVVPRENALINEIWASDRDRFSYEAVASADRISQPLLKRDGKWEEVDWETALQAVVSGLKQVIKTSGADSVGALVSPSATTEEHYLLQALLRGIECNNIDHRLRVTDVSDQDTLPAVPRFDVSTQDIQNQKVILLIGVDVHREQPLIGNRVRKATRRAAPIMAINPLDFHVNFPLAEKQIVPPSQMISSLAGLLKAVSDVSAKPVAAQFSDLLATTDVHTVHQAMAQQLQAAGQGVLLVGALLGQHPQAATLRVLVSEICRLSGMSMACLTPGANTAGAWLAGSVPHRGSARQPIAKPGLGVAKMLAQQLKAFVLLGVEPELDCANPALAKQAMQAAEFVVAITPFRQRAMDEYANVILPSVPYTENAGTYVSVDGHWQSFAAAVPPFAQARPAWKILRVLGNLFNLDGFAFVSAQQVCDHVKDLVAAMPTTESNQYSALQTSFTIDTGKLEKITQWGIYRVDSLVRRAPALQAAASSDGEAALRVPQSVMEHFELKDVTQVKLKQGDCTLELPLKLDDRVPDNCVLLVAGYDEVVKSGESFAAVELEV